MASCGAQRRRAPHTHVRKLATDARFKWNSLGKSTGPLTVGHGRNAVLGDTLARLFEATGYRVTREYYFNDGGRQMKLLGESVRVRYLQELGREPRCPRRLPRRVHPRNCALANRAAS